MKLAALVPLVILLLACQPGSAQVETVVNGSFGVSVSAKIKGYPFSADVVRNEEFHLPNGKVMKFEIHGKMYRDSQGRTRTDRQWLVNGRMRVEPSMIVDPVQQTVITIEHNSKTVMIRHGADSYNMPETTEKTIEKPALEETLVPGSERLGTMVLEGFTAVGTRYTRSEQPLDRDESWVSDDLPGTVLMMKSEGPQAGTVITTRLVNIKKAEPDPHVFQPPADYAVREAGIYPAFKGCR
jgi:hypothetical protein